MGPIGYRLAIDLGPTGTTAAVIWPDGRFVRLASDGTTPPPSADPLDQIAGVFAQIAEQAFSVGGGWPAEVVLTHPDSWDPAGLVEAAHRVGLDPPTLIPAGPVAEAGPVGTAGWAGTLAPAGAAPRSSRTAWLVAGVFAVVVAIATTTVILVARGGGNETATPSATRSATATSPAPSTSDGRTVSCTWFPEPAGPGIKPVGVPPAEVPATGTRTMTMSTDQGEITIEVDVATAPCTAASMAHLAGRRYFENTPCHRLTTEGIWVLQCGDPTGTGLGGPDYRFATEGVPSSPSYQRGDVAMAHSSEPDSNGSQFFIMYRESPIPADYTLLGRVTGGLDVVDKVAAAGTAGTPSVAGTATTDDGPPNLPIKVRSLTIS